MRALINQNIELAELLIYLADEVELSRQQLPNAAYTIPADDYFRGFRRHPAVELTGELIRRHSFIYARPIMASLELPRHLRDGESPLNGWARLAEDFRRESGFDVFQRERESYYQSALDTVNTAELRLCVDFTEAYFREKPDSFSLIMCALNGSFGFTFDEDGRRAAYAVRFLPRAERVWDGDFFLKGVAHEYAHCFVNPVVEAAEPALAARLPWLCAEGSPAAAYNTACAVMNEYLVRAYTLRFIERNRGLFIGFDLDAEYARQRRDFPRIEGFVRLLREYEETGDGFAAFYKAFLAGEAGKYL